MADLAPTDRAPDLSDGRDAAPDAALVSETGRDGPGREADQDAAADSVEPHDGAIDEASQDASGPVEVEPARVAECSDRNPCTVDTWNGVACTHTPVADGSRCDDGDTCTVGDACQAGRCVPGPASHVALAELGRLDSFGTENGVVVPTGDGRIVFLDRADLKTVVHATHLEGGTLVVESATYPDEDQPSVLWSDSFFIYAGWPGHVVVTNSVVSRISLVTIAAAGAPTIHEAFYIAELPSAGGSLSGGVKAFAGHGTDLWACVVYNSFVGTSSSILARFDLTDPDAPVLAQTIDSPATCDNLAISADGQRVYASTSKGIYWLEPAVTDAEGGVVVQGPFGVSSRLTIDGDTLLAADKSSAVLYDERDRSEFFRVEDTSVVGAAYVPAQHTLVWMKHEKLADGKYRRWLLARDTRALDAGAPTDEVLLSYSTVGDAAIPRSDDVVFDLGTKAAFRVAEGKLVRLSLPMLGGIGNLSTNGRTLGVWSSTAWHAVDLSDPTRPAWVEPGGPVSGRATALGLDVGSSQPRLIDPADRTNTSIPPQASCLQARSSGGDATMLALRDGRLWNQATDAGQVLLAGGETSTFAFSDEALFRFDALVPGEARLRRWDRALLVASEQPVAPRDDITIPLIGLPTAEADSGNISYPLIDFPAGSDIGLGVVPYTLATDGSTSSGTVLLWIDRSVAPPRVVEQLPLDPSIKALSSCRMAGSRVVCLSRELLVFIERGARDGRATVHSVAMEYDHRAILAFDGATVYLAKEDGLQAFAFDATPEELAQAPSIRFSHFPLDMAEVEGALVVASAHELVTLAPACTGR